MRRLLSFLHDLNIPPQLCDVVASWQEPVQGVGYLPRGGEVFGLDGLLGSVLSAVHAILENGPCILVVWGKRQHAFAVSDGA
jgi:hypothetical protein